MQNRTVIPFYFNSSYGVVNEMFRHIANALGKIGYEIKEIPTEAYSTETALLSAVKGMLGNTGQRILLLTSAGHLLDKMAFEGEHIANVSWLVDHPSYHYDRLKLGKKTAVISANPVHSRFIEDLTPAKYLFDSISCVTQVSKDHAQDPKYDYLIASTWMGEPENFWDKFADSSLRRLTKTGIEALLENELLDPYQVYSELFSSVGLGASEVHQKVISYCCMQSDLFLRKYSRIKIVSAIVSSGRTVLFVGGGWSNVLGDSANLTLVPNLNFEQLIHLVPSCRYVLNLNAPSGASERVSSAFQCGRPVVSQISISMEKLQTNGAGIRTFSLVQDLENLKNFFRNCPDNYERDQCKVMEETGVSHWSEIAERLDSSLWRI